MPERFRKDVSKMEKGIKGMVAVLLTAAELAEKVTSNSFLIGSYKYKKTVFKLAK